MLHDGEEVRCQISAVAIDELIGGPRGTHVDREAQFLELREIIERLSAAKFEAGTVTPGSILCIFAKDVRKSLGQKLEAFASFRAKDS